MQISKIVSFVAITLSLILTGCDLPKPKQKIGPERSNQTGDFFLSSVAGSLTNVDSLEDVNASVRTIGFHACLKYLVNSKPIQNQTFQVKDHSEAVRSDTNGCIQWQEDIKFNPLSNPQYVILKREVVGQGLIRGQIAIEIGVNPWLTNSRDMVVDVRNRPLPSAVRGEKEVRSALNGESNFETSNLNEVPQNSRRLFIDNGRIFISEQGFNKDGLKVQVEFTTTPTVQLFRSNGQSYLRTLQKGTFETQLLLIHKIEVSGKEVFHLLGESEIITDTVINERVSFLGNIQLKNIPTRGQIFLGVRMKPIKSDLNLLPFEGIYLTGEHDRFKAAFFGRLSSKVLDNPNFKIDSLLTPNLKIDELPLQKAQIEVAPLEFRFLRIGKETTTSREVVIVVKACLKNGLDQAPVRGQTFQVTKFQSENPEQKVVTEKMVESIKTDNNSCLFWDETIQFKYFECQRFIPGTVKIENAELGMNQELKILVNPWEAWSASSPGRDARYIRPSEVQINQCQDEGRLRTHMQLTGFSYNMRAMSYEIDENLSLFVKKHITVRLEPHILFYTSLSSGRSETQRLRDGVYLLKFAIIKNKDYDNSNTYVAHDEKIVNVNNGEIVAELILKTPELKALGNRNTALIEVFPVDEKKLKTLAPGASLDSVIDTESGLEPDTFTGTVILNLDDAYRNLYATKAERMTDYFVNGKDVRFNGSLINKVAAEGAKVLRERKESLRKKSTPEYFAKASNLNLIRLNDSKKTDVFANIASISPHLFPNGGSVGSRSVQFEHLMASNRARNTEAIKNLTVQGSLQKDFAQQLCAYWFFQHFSEIHQKYSAAYSKALAGDVVRQCMNQVAKDPAKFFLVEKRLMVQKASQGQLYAGYNKAANVGVNFSMQNSYNSTLTQSVSWASKVGLSWKFWDVFSFGTDVQYNINQSWAKGKSESNAINIGAQTTLNVEMNVMQVTLDSYEQCSVVRLNPRLFINDETAHWFNKAPTYNHLINSKLKESQAAELITSGLMFCSGVVQNQPIKRYETYFLIAQNQWVASQQDSADERNRQFFLSLRGAGEFEKFVHMTKLKAQYPVAADEQDNSLGNLMKFMSSNFEHSLPVYPGNYVEQTQPVEGSKL